MADNINIDVSQVSALAASISASGGRVGAQVAQVVRASGARVERASKQIAPVDTGNLRNSISTTQTGDGRSTSISVAIGPTANYGIFVEEGTSRMRPQPFMGPAFEQVVPQFVSAIETLAAGGL